MLCKTLCKTKNSFNYPKRPNKLLCSIIGINSLKKLILENEQPEGNAIKAARLKAQLTVAEVGEILGIPTRTITSWEVGERKPPEWSERLLIEKLNWLGNKTE